MQNFMAYMPTRVLFGIDKLKMSDYRIVLSEFEKIAKNARETMGSLFAADPVPLSDNDVVKILKKSYR